NLDAEVQPFHGSRAEENQVTRFSKHDIVCGLPTGHMDKRATDGALQNRAVRLTKAPSVVRLDAQGGENLPWHPRQFRSGINQHSRDRSALPWTRGVLEFDIDAEATHILGHECTPAGLPSSTITMRQVSMYRVKPPGLTRAPVSDLFEFGQSLSPWLGGIDAALLMVSRLARTCS